MDQDSYKTAVSNQQTRLQALYDQFVEIGEPAQLEAAKSILDRIGKIDLEGESLKSRDNQRDLSIKFHWGHDHRFSDDLYVKGRMGDRHINLMSQFMARYRLAEDHFKGKDVIDVGCWTGGTTLLLKAMGANRVLALEEVQKYARAASDLCALYEQSDIVSDGTNLFDLVTDEKYDIAYFPGVVYHLSDPVLGLRRLFNAVKNGGEVFVETMGLDSEKPICRYDGNRLHHNNPNESSEALNRGGWNWFIPSPSCLERWMREAGFEEIDCFYSHLTNRVFGYGKRKQYVDITRAGFSVPDIE